MDNIRNYSALLLCFIDLDALSQAMGVAAQAVGVGVGLSALFLNYANYRKTKQQIKKDE